MRVSYVGNFSPRYSTENDVREAFEELGWDLILLQEDQVSIESIRKAAFQSELLLWTSTWDGLFRLDDVLDLRYELVRRSIPSATLHLDTFWPTKRGDRRWWVSPMFQMEHVFTADGDWEGNWKALGVNHRWLLPAIRRSACGLGRPRDEYACDVAFVGSNGRGYHEEIWGYRQRLVDQLREMCARRGWRFRNPGGDDPKIERSSDMNDFYASCRVAVGDSLCVKRGTARYWSDRVPETLGRGGRLIMPQIDALRWVFPERLLPMYEWSNWADLESKIETELQLPAGARERRRDDALKQVQNQHTYVQRIQTILSHTGLSAGQAHATLAG